jgi:chromosome partitioning protein
VLPTRLPSLKVLSSTVDLSAAEIELIGDENRNDRLKNALAEARGQYDFILLDCPPSLGLLTLNALCAADAVLVPLQCEFFALEGLSMLLRTIERVRRTLNPRLQLRGVVLTMFDKRNNLSSQVATDVRSFLGHKVFQTIIPRNVRVSEAPSHGKPVLLYDVKSSGSQAYAHLAREMLQQDRKLKKVA